MADYYIAPWGNDVNAGTLASPQRHLSSIRLLCAPGDTVWLHPGVYAYAGDIAGSSLGDEADEWRTTSGTVGNPITIRSLVPHAAILDCRGSVFSDQFRGALRVHNCTYIHFRDFRIRNSPGRFINSTGSCSHITIENMIFSKCIDAGLSFGCIDGGQVTNTYVVSACEDNIDNALGGGGWPIGVRPSSSVDGGASDNVIWDRVHVSRVWGEGGGVAQGSNALWTNCSFHNNWSVCGVYMGGSDGPHLADRTHARMTLAKYNRVVAGGEGGQHGFTFASEEVVDPEVSNMTMTNCTVDAKPVFAEGGGEYGIRGAFRHAHYQPQLDRSYRNLVVQNAKVGIGCRYGISTDTIPVEVTNRPANCEFINSVVIQQTVGPYFSFLSDADAWSITGNTTITV